MTFRGFFINFVEIVSKAVIYSDLEWCAAWKDDYYMA